jgi:uncharacterized membrane protein YphA (DoxX/SURF4 family)
MNTENPLPLHHSIRLMLTLLRIFLGWHFLYEGLAKLFSPWSSAGYLLESQWILSGMFHRIAENPVLLQTTDLLVIAVLLLAGTGLMLGILTRISAGAGAFLILLFYMANPPFIGYMSETTGEGHYLIINKQLIEMAVLILLVLLPKDLFWGLDHMITRWRRGKTGIREEQPLPEPSVKGRREMLKDLVSLPFLGGFAWMVWRKRRWESFEERMLVSDPSRVDAVSGSTSRVQFSRLDQLKSKVPTGRIKGYEISRLICGGNLLSGFAHSRDLIYVSKLVQSYFSDEKVLETFKICEAVGVNTMVVRVDNNTLRVLEKYRKRGGTMQWIAQCKVADDDIRSDIDAAVGNGAIGVYLHGGICDDLVRANRMDHLLACLEYMKKHDHILAGLAGHDLRVIIESEKHGLDPDFYMKTLNSGNYWTAGPRLIDRPDWTPDPERVVEPEFGSNVHDNIWSETPEQTVDYMNRVEKPWIAYKVLGAGAIHPKDGFHYAFSSGADFACVGMFDFQVVDDANILGEVLENLEGRSRDWKA